jgi:hypothetical protein
MVSPANSGSTVLEEGHDGDTCPGLVTPEPNNGDDETDECIDSVPPLLRPTVAEALVDDPGDRPDSMLARWPSTDSADSRVALEVTATRTAPQEDRPCGR